MKYFRSFRRRSRALIISAALSAAAVSGCSGSAALDYNDFFELQKSYLISQISSQAGAWFKAWSRTVGVCSYQKQGYSNETGGNQA